MPTLKQYVEKMLAIAPGDALGRQENITSLTTTTVVCSSMAFGTLTADRFKYKWLWRPDTGTAVDRYRLASNFTASTGTFTHAGTNYADTTATSETVFILEYEPKLFIDAIQTTLSRILRNYEYEVPLPKGGRRITIPSGMDWVTSPGQITHIAADSSPVLSRNRYFEKWSTLQSSGGTLASDDWTLSGASATLARTTSNRRGRYAAVLTRSGTNCTLYQEVDVLNDGVNSIVGDSVTFVANLRCGTASRARISITPYTGGTAGTATNSSYHTGGGAWEELTATYSVATGVDTLRVAIEVNTGDVAVTIDEAYLFTGTDVSDTERIDGYTPAFLTKDDYTWEFPQIIFSAVRRGRLLLYSGRPYPQFDSSRILAGSADLDSSDAPLLLVATGAIARLFEGLAQGSGEDTTRYRQIASEWQGRFARLAMKHRNFPDHMSGVDFPAHMFASAPRSF